MRVNLLVAGLDEAGRGPVVGPMAIACAVFDDKGRRKLANLKVRDSKKVSPKRRAEIEPDIKKAAREWKVVLVSPADIDRQRKSESLNVIEAKAMARLLVALECQPARILVDAADSVAANFAAKIAYCVEECSPGFVLSELVAEHKADDRFPEVGAASILAKVARDQAVEDLKKELGDFGSGYPADEATKNWLRQRIQSGDGLTEHVRRSWSTISKGKQTSLGDF